MFNYLTAIILFATYVFIDMLYAYYVICVGKGESLKAATCSMFIYTLLSYGVVSYSTNIYYIIPIALGAWLGSFIVVEYEKRKKAKDPK